MSPNRYAYIHKDVAGVTSFAAGTTKHGTPAAPDKPAPAKSVAGVTKHGTPAAAEGAARLICVAAVTTFGTPAAPTGTSATVQGATRPFFVAAVTTFGTPAAPPSQQTKAAGQKWRELSSAAAGAEQRASAPAAPYPLSTYLTPAAPDKPAPAKSVAGVTKHGTPAAAEGAARPICVADVTTFGTPAASYPLSTYLTPAAPGKTAPAKSVAGVTQIRHTCNGRRCCKADLRCSCHIIWHTCSTLGTSAAHQHRPHTCSALPPQHLPHTCSPHRHSGSTSAPQQTRHTSTPGTHQHLPRHSCSKQWT